ncbi:SH3 domain-containing protein [Streptomyces sp. H51]|uniref:SH3 domain-containing protein n=1 Tax=Streptomyces sp. H51 TaxID=3111770 RepID=UPI002D76B6EC|nr:SH3 domain-containing protein [Streptomyces sp. H51]
MSLRSPLARLAIAAAAGALVTSAVATPALADDWGQDDGQSSGQYEGQYEDQSGGQYDGGRHDRFARGVVTASTLLLRSAPNRGSQVIRVAHRGEHVSIFCKTTGESVQGDRLWYLLPDGTWAWGAARFIDVIGAPPRWC